MALPFGTACHLPAPLRAGMLVTMITMAARARWPDLAQNVVLGKGPNRLQRRPRSVHVTGAAAITLGTREVA